MAKYPDDLSALHHDTDVLGLVCFGAFELEDSSAGLLIGNAGPAMWDVFSKSPEYGDGKPDPMNRWTERVIFNLANSHNCRAVYPFDKPFPPFQKYARAATGIKSSPLGILVHPEYGLWHAFRAVLVFEPANTLFAEVKKLIQVPQNLIHVCDECVEKPCLTACPVNAFSSSGLDVATCFKHIDGDQSPDCMMVGCQARGACPVGKKYRYSPEQLQYHMQAYRN